MPAPFAARLAHFTLSNAFWNSAENLPSTRLISEPVSQSTGTMLRALDAFATAVIHAARDADSRTYGAVPTATPNSPITTGIFLSVLHVASLLNKSSSAFVSAALPQVVETGCVSLALSFFSLIVKVQGV